MSSNENIDGPEAYISLQDLQKELLDIYGSTDYYSEEGAERRDALQETEIETETKTETEIKYQDGTMWFQIEDTDTAWLRSTKSVRLQDNC